MKVRQSCLDRRKIGRFCAGREKEDVFLPAFSYNKYGKELDMKATLIIANIHGLYAVDQKTGKPVCLKQAFVAMHHDRIIDHGCGDHHR